MQLNSIDLPASTLRRQRKMRTVAERGPQSRLRPEKGAGSVTINTSYIVYETEACSSLSHGIQGFEIEDGG
jgi:hypothetical protein